MRVERAQENLEKAYVAVLRKERRVDFLLKIFKLWSSELPVGFT